MLDAGLVLYVALLVLWIWRWLTWWRDRGTRLVYLNYCFLLYFVTFVLLLHAVYIYAITALRKKGRAAWEDLPGWLRPFMLGAPVAACVVFLLCAAQTLQHVNEIRKDRAISKHDRAIQILALPAVYGVMAMTSLSRLYELTTSAHEAHSTSGVNSTFMKEQEELYMSRSETCFWVGDLYEAWALYQFAKLTLELIFASVNKMRRSPDAAQRENAGALIVAIGAVESLAWLGVILFLVVCVLQAGWSLYLLSFTAPISDWSEYNHGVAQFSAAGMVASAGAIYNVHVVESTFHVYFEDYRPLLKFITVKIIVSFAFFQKGTFSVLQAFKATLPDMMRKVTDHVPLLGQVLNFSEVQFQLFYDSLLLYECILICLLHWWGWSAYEDWYLDDDQDDEEAGERRPLLG